MLVRLSDLGRTMAFRRRCAEERGTGIRLVHPVRRCFMCLAYPINTMMQTASMHNAREMSRNEISPSIAPVPSCPPARGIILP